MMAKRLKVHPYCEFFPRMEGAELDEFNKSLGHTGGNDVPSLVWAGYVLDGRHRSEGSEVAGTEHYVQEWRPKTRDHIDQQLEILDLVESRNLHRRHLTPSQRAHAVEMIDKERRKLMRDQGVGGPEEIPDKDLRQRNSEKHPEKSDKDGGGNIPTPPSGGKSSVKNNARKSKTDRKTQKAARAVVEKGTPALNDAVAAGKVTASDAEKVVDQPPEVQDAAVEAVKSGKAKTVAAAVAEASTPFDEALQMCIVVLDHFVPKMQEHAIAIQRALGSGAGTFTSGKIANLAAKIFDEFKSVRPVLENAKKKFQCNSAK